MNKDRQWGTGKRKVRDVNILCAVDQATHLDPGITAEDIDEPYREALDVLVAEGDLRKVTYYQFTDQGRQSLQTLLES